MTGPSRHLSWSELACDDRIRTPYPLDWRATRAVELATAFEALRAAVGLPLVVQSAYRTPAHNRAVGGAPHSQHVQGRALDLAPPDGWSPIALLAVAQDIPAIRGLGLYDSFIHIDVRPAPRVVWDLSSSSGRKAER
jgi:uncharacterized protein YcbK (DUF882 family)